MAKWIVKKSATCYDVYIDEPRAEFISIQCKNKDDASMVMHLLNAVEATLYSVLDSTV